MSLPSFVLGFALLLNGLLIPPADAPAKKFKYKNNEFGIELSFPEKYTEEAIEHELGSSISVSCEHEGLSFSLHCTKHSKKLRQEDAGDLALVAFEHFLKASGGKQLKLAAEELNGVKGHAGVIKTENAMWYYHSYLRGQLQYQVLVSVPDPIEGDALRDEFFKSLKFK